MEPTTSINTPAGLALAVPELSSREIELAKLTEVVSEMARSSCVDLDIPAEAVANMALLRHLEVEEIDAMMLARQDHDARFSVMELLLRSGFTTEQIHAGFFIVDAYYDGPYDKEYESFKEVTTSAKEEVPESLEALVAQSISKPAQNRDHQGYARLQKSRRDKYVAMICAFLASLDVFDDLRDLDDVQALLNLLVIRAKDCYFVEERMPILVSLTKILAVVQEEGLATYDDVLRRLEGGV